MTTKPLTHTTAKNIQKKSWMKSTAISPSSFLVAGLALTGTLITANTAYAVGKNATPTGETVVAGSATFKRPEIGKLNVKQTSQRVVIDWDKFNIGKDATTKFVQPNSNATAVNRVTGPGNDPTKILGTLKANGNVMILDGNGVIFGKNSVVDVGGLIASTGDIDVDKFMNGDMQITLDSIDSGKVINKGAISIKDGGLLAFVAPHAANQGTITAKLGRVSIGAGSKAVIDFSGDQLVQIALTDELENALVENSGQILAAGSRVELTARAAKTAVDTVINMDGIIKADSFDVQDGKIILDGGNKGKVEVAGTMESKGRVANKKTRNAAIKLGLATGEEPREATGGAVEVYGQAIDLTNTANINTSGANGGGTVSIGNAATESVRIANGSRIITRALQYGNAGTVNITSSGLTDYAGFIGAQGGATSGNGGAVSISSDGTLVYNGTVDTSAENGVMGTTTLDPADIVVWDGFGAIPMGSSVNAQTLVQTLGLSNVHIIAGNSITLLDDLDLSHYNMGVDLTTGNLTLTSNVLNFTDLTMGTGDVFMNANTVNMHGVIFGSDGSVIDAARLHNTASVINVLSSDARIQQAIDMAVTGTAVNVHGNGATYHENLTVHKALTLSGVGGIAPVLMGTTANGDVVRVTASNVTVDGFDIRADIVGSSDTSGFGVRVETGADFATINNNKISDMGSYAVYATGTQGGSIANNTITTSGADAIISLDNGNLTISGNTITGPNRLRAITMGGNGVLTPNTIIGNTITGSTGDAIYSTGITPLNIIGNTITNTGGSAINLMRSTALTTTITDNVIQGTGAIGISIYDGNFATANILRNTISDTALHGIALRVGSANYTLTSNTITNAGRDGIYLHNLSGSYLGQSNIVRGSAQAGLNIFGSHGSFISRGSTFDNNTSHGVLSSYATGVRIENATISANGSTGAVLLANSNSAIVNSNISNGAADAVIVDDGRNIDVNNNIITDFGGNAVVANNQVATLRIQGNGIYGVVNDAIQLNGISGAVVSGNRTNTDFYGSIGRDFIHVNGGANNRILNNRITANGGRIAVGRDAIHIENDTNSTILGNTVTLMSTPVFGAPAVTNHAPHLFGSAAVGRDTVHAVGGTGTIIENNYTTARGTGTAAMRHGVYVTGGTNVTIRGNQAQGNLDTFGPGGMYLGAGDIAGVGENAVHVENSTGTDILNNTVSAIVNTSGAMPPMMGTTYGAKGHGVYVADSLDTEIVNNNIFATKNNGMGAPVMLAEPMPTPTGEPAPMPTGEPMSRTAAVGAGQNAIHVENSTDTVIQNNNIFVETFASAAGIEAAGMMMPPLSVEHVMGAGQNAIYVSGNTNTQILNNAIEARHHFFGPAMAASSSPFVTTSYTAAGENGIYAQNERDLSISGNRINAYGDGNMRAVSKDGIFVDNSRRASIANNSFFASFSAQGVGENGIHVTSSNGVDIVRNRFHGGSNQAAVGQNGIQVIDSNNADIIGNNFFSDGYGLATGRDGIYLNNSAGSLIAYNSMNFGKPRHKMPVRMMLSNIIGNHGINLVNSDNAVVRDNTVSRTAKHGIRLHKSDNSRIKDNDVDHTGGTGILVTRDMGTKILLNTVSDTALRGIHVANSIENEIRRNTVENTGKFGIYVHKSGYASVIANETNNTGMAGIRIEKSDNASVVRNTVENSYNWNGINIIDSDHAVIDRNYVTSANTNGIRLADSEDAIVTNNEVASAGHAGIRVINSDRAFLEGNDIYEGQGNGIHVSGSDDIQIHDNDVEDQGGHAIFAENSHNASIRENKTRDVAGDHIRLEESDDARIIDNNLAEVNPRRDRGEEEDQNGIKLIDSDDARIQANVIRNMDDDGIDLEDSSGARIIRNTVRNADDDGIHIKGGRDIRLVDNTITDAGDNGVQLDETRKIRIIGNVIRGSDVEGIEGDDVRNLRIRDNVIAQTGDDAINLEDTRNVRVLDNVIRHADDEGVEINDSRNVQVNNNRIIDTSNAIEFDDVTEFVIAQNRIKDAWNGINLDDATDGLVLANRVIDTRNYGIYVDDSEAVDIHNNKIKSSFVAPEPTPEPTPEGTPSPTGFPMMMDYEQKPRQFGTGIYVSDSDDISIKRNVVNDKWTGIRLRNADDVKVVNNLVNDNYTGFHAEGTRNEDILFKGNVFVNNTYGATFNSGIVTFAGVNQFFGGNTALTFAPIPLYNEKYEGDMRQAAMMDYPEATGEPMPEPEMEWSRLELVDNTIGEVNFVGQRNFFIELQNGAFFDPDQPTIIDATNSVFNGVEGGLMSAAELQAIEDMIWDYDDLNRLGQIFAGFTAGIDPSDVFLEDLAALLEFNAQGRVTIVNLPFIPGPNGQIDPADLARLAPAAGGDENPTDPESLGNLEPAAGEEEVKCWAQLGQKVGSGAVSFNFDATPSAILAGQAACSDL